MSDNFGKRGMNISLPQQRANQTRNLQYTKMPPSIIPKINPTARQTGGGIPVVPTGGVPGSGLLPVSLNGNERSYPVEVQISSAQSQYQFPDIQTLLGKRIIAFESFSASEVPYGPISGIANIPQAAQKAMFIQLNDATNTALMDRHALVDFDPQLNNGLIRFMDYTNIVWTNCKIFLPTNAAGTIAAPPYIAYFVIHYLANG